ncbi:MAG: hypothetical protein ACP5O0_00950 [Acidimicrobiales bacterium]
MEVDEDEQLKMPGSGSSELHGPRRVVQCSAVAEPVGANELFQAAVVLSGSTSSVKRSRSWVFMDVQCDEEFGQA